MLSRLKLRFGQWLWWRRNRQALADAGVVGKGKLLKLPPMRCFVYGESKHPVGIIGLLQGDGSVKIEYKRVHHPLKAVYPDEGVD